MSSPQFPRSPKYRYHKARDCAVVTLAGRDHYLGTFNSPASWEKYHRLVAEHFAAPSPLPPITPDTPLTVTELIARYWSFAQAYYRKDGAPTSELASVKLAVRFVRRLYGATAAAEFGPKRLKAVREAMITHPQTRRVKRMDSATGQPEWERKVVRRGLARRCLNKLVGRVKRMFAWAVEEELVPVEVHAALLRVKGLRKGQSAAREMPRVRAVPEAAVSVVLPLLPATVRAMVEVQRLTGCRPQEVVQLRAAELTTTAAVWEYRPRRHKGEHHAEASDRERVIYLGPKCQAILRPWLDGADGGYLFSPARSEAARLAGKGAGGDGLPLTDPRDPPRKRAAFAPHYRVASYRQAVRRACVRAGIATWKPHQLRHSRLTEIRERYGLEASRVVGGHREIGATQLYAEADRGLAVKVMAEMG
jgi:integrase